MAGLPMHRVWAWVSSALAGGTTVLYVAVIAGEGGDAFWEVFPWAALMLVGTGAAVVAAVSRDVRVARAFALSAAVVTAAIGVLGILTIGLGFLLASVAAALAAVTSHSA